MSATPSLTWVLPQDARCEVCGQHEALLLGAYPLPVDDGAELVILCRNHAAPLNDTRSLELPTRGELLEFWAERRSRIVWLSRERRARPRP